VQFGVGLYTRVGWQPSRFLTDRAQAERAFQLAEQLGSVNAAAKELGTTWPSLREAFGATAWHARPQPPEAVRQRAIAAARQRNGQRAIPAFDPVLVALKPGAPYRNGLQLPRAMGPPATRVRCCGLGIGWRGGVRWSRKPS
jgi:hypothetical protein